MHISQPIFGLLTDFGFDYAVASMKGVIAQTFPTAQIIDIDHSLQKFSIISGAFILQKSMHYFPQTMVFICVVDPGVGSQREMLAISINGQWFLGPDNGIFHYLLKKENKKVYRIVPEFFGSSSRTFHGRDLFTPAAVAIAQGRLDFLQTIDEQKLITIPQLDTQTMATYIDSFGNIKTNIVVTNEPPINTTLTVLINEKAYEIPYQLIFANIAMGKPLCYKGSNDTLEIAINNGSASTYFNVSVGTLICVNYTF
ncbi:MAG TPA: SAM-dependent chlorinase/fluorinase [Candidatus Babeliales bacterium]|jgi:hypothetical protein|nr:SAM-dependent chlorinase/fluorinase [Candidatus Babeliales bacterium]